MAAAPNPAATTRVASSGDDRIAEEFRREFWLALEPFSDLVRYPRSQFVDRPERNEEQQQAGHMK